MPEQWIELAKQQPPIVDMDQTDYVLVAYYPGPDSELAIDIAFYDKDGKGSGWFQKETWKYMPAPRYWMPLPSVPTAPPGDRVLGSALRS